MHSVGLAPWLFSEEASEGIRKRFAQVRELGKHADHKPEAGREYMAAYVDYVEGLHEAASQAARHHHGEAEAVQEEAAPQGHAH